MQYVADHYKNYTKTVQNAISNRRQHFDRRSQLYSVTQNPELGEKLPCYVKFPKLSRQLDVLPRKHPWAQHRLGKHNGLYFIPTKATTESCTNSNWKNVVFGDCDITADFFDHPLYKMISKGMEYMHLKIDTTQRPGLIRLSRQNVNIMQETAELDKWSEYCKLHNLLCNLLSPIYSIYKIYLFSFHFSRRSISRNESPGQEKPETGDSVHMR